MARPYSNLKRIGLVFKRAPTKKTEEIVLAAVSENGNLLRSAPTHYRQNYQIVLAAVQQNGYALLYASDELKDNRTIVMAAVTRNGYALNYASTKLKNDYLIILKAVQEDGIALKAIQSFEMKQNIQIVSAALCQNINALDYAPSKLTSDFDFMLFAVKMNGYALQFASSKLQNNLEIVSAAVKNISNGFGVLKYASNDAKNNLNIVLVAVAESYHSFGHISSEMQELVINYLNLKMHHYSLSVSTFLSTILFVCSFSYHKEDSFSSSFSIKHHLNTNKKPKKKIGFELLNQGKYLATDYKKLIGEYAGLQIGEEYQFLVKVRNQISLFYSKRRPPIKS